MSVPEAEVAKLGSEERIQAHYADELRLNELFALSASSFELLEGWDTLPEDERAKFLEERDAVVRRGDKLAAGDEAVSTLLTESFANARRKWATVREGLLQLT